MKHAPLRPFLLPALLVVCAAVYLAFATGPWAKDVWKSRSARDFASYYYAVQVAWQGGDPYDSSQLDDAASKDRTRAEVYPFFYPPPFLAAFAWVVPLELKTAYRAWFVADHVLLFGILLLLWAWMPRGPPGDGRDGRDASLRRIFAAGLALFALTYAPIPDNDRMGQVNLLVVVATLGGLLLAGGLVPAGTVPELRARSEESSENRTSIAWIPAWREALGGALVGLACMLKMSPALFVALWLLRRRWRPAIWACLSGLVLSVASLPVAGPAVQARFYTEVLPGFGSGDYHGLKVPILLPTNHSIPSIFAEIWPDGPTTLSLAATWASRVVALALLAGIGWRLLRHPARDRIGGLCEVGALVVVMLILPVYTYEHHMVWMAVPYAAAFAAIIDRRLGWGWAAGLGVAYLFQAMSLETLRALYKLAHQLGSGGDLLYILLREAKFLAALTVAAACLVAAVRPGPGARADEGGFPPDSPSVEG